MRTIRASRSNPEYDGRTSSSRRFEEVEGGERKTQSGGGKPHQQKPGCMETSGSSSGSSGADPGFRTPNRPSSGEGGAVRLKVGIGSKPSGTWIAMILTDYSEKLERVLADIRMVVNQVTDLLRQPERQDLVASSSKGLPTLSKLSFPDNFSELPMMEELAGVEVTPESRIVRGSKDVRKSKSPEKKIRDEVMTSVSKGESGSEREEVPIPDLHQRVGQEAMSPDQETAGFLTPKMNK
jgi:hypothetical protein